jgi:hypothetical protein
MDGLDRSGVSRLEVLRFSPPRESRFPDDCYPDGYTLVGIFCLLSTKVNLVQLLSNLMADGKFSPDLTAQIISPVRFSCEPFLDMKIDGPDLLLLPI